MMRRLLGPPTALVLALAYASTSDAAPTSAADLYASECGSCHVAYPASLLRRTDWSRVIGSLEHHYGVNASLDVDTLQAVARHIGVTPVATSIFVALPRITGQPWFRAEHDEVAASTFKSARVKSAGNCSACHPGAERGNFDEHSIRMPGGRRHDD
jgi:mono/diheme cytochrome c family protein